MTEKVIVYDQDQVFFDFINKGLDTSLDSSRHQVISHVQLNNDKSCTMLAVVAYSDMRRYSIELSIYSTPNIWATKRFIHAFFDYPYFQLGKEKTVTTTLTTNFKCIDLLERLGYTREGMLKDYQGIGKDCFIYGMTKRQYLSGKWAPKQRVEEYRNKEKIR
jgi:hypothetical protein